MNAVASSGSPVQMRVPAVLNTFFPRHLGNCGANRGQWEQGCSLFMATDLGPVMATSGKKKKIAKVQQAIVRIF